MPLDFLKRKRPEPAPVDTGPALLPEDVEAGDYELKLTYRAKSSHGIRMTAGPGALEQLPALLHGVAKGDISLVEPLAVEVKDAAPRIVDPVQAMAWVNAHHAETPVTRHGLFVLESLDALDPAFETAALALLSGETDTSGYPEYDAVVGGVVSYWDETTGDIVVRAWSAGAAAACVATRSAPRPVSSRRSRRTSWRIRMRSASRLESARCRPPGPAGWSARIVGSHPGTIGRSTARSAACAWYGDKDAHLRIRLSPPAAAASM